MGGRASKKVAFCRPARGSAAGLTTRPMPALILGWGALEKRGNKASDGRWEGRGTLQEKFHWRPVAPTGFDRTLPTAGNAILAVHRTNDGNQRGSALGIISELRHSGGGVWVHHCDAKFAYGASRVIPAAAGQTAKNQPKVGRKFSRRSTRDAKNEANH